MSRQWKPSDVGVSAVGERFIVSSRGECFWSGDDRRDWSGLSGKPTETDRPLVVIDPEDREQVVALTQSYCDIYGGLYEPEGRHKRATDCMQDALRSLIADPKPAEPMGLGAVVEVESVREFMHGQKVRLVRTHATHGPWFGDNTKRDWADITGPITVLSEGVTQ